MAESPAADADCCRRRRARIADQFLPPASLYEENPPVRRPGEHIAIDEPNQSSELYVSPFHVILILFIEIYIPSVSHCQL